MTVFTSTLNQMAFLAMLIVIGYVLVKVKVLPGEAAGMLSKMENWIFVPALVLGTFMENLTPEKIGTAGQYLLAGAVMAAITMPLGALLAKLCVKDEYIRRMYTYGLAFANFGFMGNAVVLALFPDVFMEYLIFVLPLWTGIYVWGVPALLIPSGDGKKGLKSRLKALVNPMFVAMIIGMVLGLVQLPMPGFMGSVVDTLGSCMSPVAMLLTGMTIAQMDLKKILKTGSIYVVTAIRLLAIPAVGLLAMKFLNLEYGIELCTMCAISMPLGLNTIVIPAAYGQDTSVAAGMALVSHFLSCVTIPVVFMVFAMI